MGRVLFPQSEYTLATGLVDCGAVAGLHRHGRNLVLFEGGMKCMATASTANVTGTLPRSPAPRQRSRTGVPGVGVPRR